MRKQPRMRCAIWWESNRAGWEGLQAQKRNLWAKWEGDLFERSSRTEDKGGRNGRSEKIKLWIDINVAYGERFICDHGPCFPRRTREWFICRNKGWVRQAEMWNTDLVRENGPASPRHKGGCCGREESAVPFLGDDCPSLSPWSTEG